MENNKFGVKHSFYRIGDFATEEPGIYILWDWQSKPLYIGEANNIRIDLLNHVSPYSLHTNLQYVIHNIKQFSFLIENDKKKRKRIEKELIQEFKPTFNIEHNAEDHDKYNPIYLLPTQYETYAKSDLNDPLSKWSSDEYFSHTMQPINQKGAGHMRIDFDMQGVSIDGACHLSYSHSNYDDFIYILQKHGLRNLVENVSHFTITNQALITDIKNEFNL